MSTPSRLSNPVLLLAVAAAGFVAWVAYDAAHWGPPAPPPPDPPEVSAIPPDHRPPELRRSWGFLRLHPGMSRPTVERHLRGLPPTEETAEVAAGDPVLRARYRVYLTRPLPTAPPPHQFTPGLHLVTLTFDAAGPDQTLVGLSADPTQ